MDQAHATVQRITAALYPKARLSHMPRVARWVAQDMLRKRHESQDWRMAARAAINIARGA